jgi:hypothetical protein
MDLLTGNAIDFELLITHGGLNLSSMLIEFPGGIFYRKSTYECY